jgi:hypothetical protein
VRKRWLMLAMVGIIVAGAVPARGAVQVCEVRDRSREEVLPGVVLVWDSAFRCTDAPREGTYEVWVTVSNRDASVETVRIRSVRLVHTTPRPGGEGPEATAEGSGLPIVVGPGETAGFRVSGEYQLVKTEEGWKANLHLQAFGRGTDSGERFRLGINVMLRA